MSDDECEYIEEDDKPFQEDSLHPPVHETEEDYAPLPSSVLLDYLAYFDDRTNATTACSTTSRDNHSIRVTFWLARPPRVSYFTVCCPDLKPTDFAEEPVIMAAQDDLVLLCVTLLTSIPDLPGRESGVNDFFMYRAGGAGKPSLERINHPGPSRILNKGHVAILRSRSRSRSRSPAVPIMGAHGSKDDGFYVLAALVTKIMPGYHYDLHTYDSRTMEWATRRASPIMVPSPQEEYYSLSSKVIVVGGTIGWVDLWRGILFCDDLLSLLKQQEKVAVQLRYVSLPPPTGPGWSFEGCPRIARDIAVVKDRINYVELRADIRPGSYANDGDYISDDWTITAWFMKATTKSIGMGSWQPTHGVSASEISPKKNPIQFQMLLKLLDAQGRPQPTLQRLHTAHPTLSLHEGNVVYLITKIQFHTGNKGWAIAVDVRKKALQGVAQFDKQRMMGCSSTYISCGISKHLHLAPVKLVDLKRSGMPMRQPVLKKQAGIPLMDFHDSHSAQKNKDDVVRVSVGDLEQDNMDLE